jgi:hypothetical protein
MVMKKTMPKKTTTTKKTTGKKITSAQDHKMDNKFGIKDGSPLDLMLDKKVVKKATPKRKSK